MKENRKTKTNRKAKTMTAKIEHFEDKNAVYGFVTNSRGSIAYKKASPRSHKKTELIIEVNGTKVSLGAPEIKHLKKLFTLVG